MSYFSELYNSVNYPIDSDSSMGLRNAQLGAIHALIAHSTLETTGAAIIVMPTGTGKTSVLMLAPYVLRKSKVLIVTPSVMVRGQIADDYKQLKTLRKIGVFNDGITPPKVFEAKHSISTESEDDISSADVVVASPQVAASIAESVQKNLFDYVIIDEAHHVPAPTWQKILHNMEHVASLLVTATPFRLDKKTLQGTNVYTYPLSKAYRDGIFSPVSFIPIDEAPNKDQLIAKETERVFLNDRSNGFEHFVMVRTDTKEKAKRLETVYKDNTSLKLKRIDSSMSYVTIKKTINLLKEKQLDGVICVDMLGEGFDFPNLKIAAIHEPQKSLASALQFIGRFARTNAEKIGTAKFIAMNDESLRIENKRLYTSDAIWQDMIIELADGKISHDKENNDAIKKYSRQENSQELVSLHSIKPNCHAKVYRVENFNIEANFPSSLSIGENFYRSSDTDTIIGISINNYVPLWLEGTQEINTEVNLYIVHYQKETKLLFIYSQQKTEFVYDSIVESFCSKHSKIPRNEMNRVLAGFTNYEFFNTGMQNRYSESGESYRIYAGSNTAASIDETTGMMLSAGHAFCKVTQNSEDTTIGYSSGSKLWSCSYLPIPEYIAWCDNLGKKIADSSISVKTNTNYDKLPMPEGIHTYQKDILFCFLSEKTYLSPPSLHIKDSTARIASLTDADINIVEVTVDGTGIVFDFSLDGVSEKIVCDVNGEYTIISESQFMCRNGNNSLTLSDYFNENPLFFKASDGTVYYGHEVLHGNADFEKYDRSTIIDYDWRSANTDISSEVRGGKHKVKKGMSTIQETLQNLLEQGQHYSHILFDHGTGEIADYLTFESNGDVISVEMYHCKAMKGKNYNSAVEDIYEVAQQSIKSTVWIKSKSALLEKIQARIKGNSNNKFVRGDIKSLKDLLKSTKIMTVTIYIVQPALSKSEHMEDTVSKIILAASFYIKNTGRAKELRILGSP